MVGFDHRTGEIRTFAVDRIRTLRPTPDTFVIDANFDFDSYIGSSFGVIAEPAIPVRIRFDRSWVTWVEERTWHPSQEIERLPGGDIELRMMVGGTAELRSWVLSFGPGATVVEPASLRDEVVRELEAALRRYVPAARRSGRRSGPAPRSSGATSH